MKDKEVELSKDEKKEIIEVAGKYGEYLSENATHIDGNNLNYYFAGSLAGMLYGNAREIQYINLDGNKIISDGEKKEISEETRKSLMNFGRKIGDIDIVQVGDKGLIQDLEQPIREPGMSISIDSNWGYISNERYVEREIPNINRLHSKSQVQRLFNEDAINGGLNGTVTKDRVCKLTTNNGKTIYVASPETIIAQKLNKAMGNFGTEYEEKKDARDIAIFINSISKSYNENELKDRIVEAWLEIKEPIEINAQNEKKKKNILVNMYRHDMIPVIENEGYEDTTRLKIIGNSVLKYINKRLRLEEKQTESLKRIAYSNTSRNVNELQNEIRSGIRDREIPENNKYNDVSVGEEDGNR